MSTLKPSSLRHKLHLPRSNRSSGHNTPKDALSDAESTTSARSHESTATTDNTTDDAELVSSKYALRVTCGPSYDASTHQTVKVNSEHSCEIDSEFMKCRVKVRIRKYDGLPKPSPATSPYFTHPAHKNDRFSLDFSFIPLRDLPATDIVWGNDFDTPIRDRLPPAPLFNTAFKIIKTFVDPGLDCDVYAEKPWMYGPALSTWSAFSIGGNYKAGEYAAALDAVEGEFVSEGATGSGVEVRAEEEIPASSEKRRKHFLAEANRAEFDFEEGRLYRGDYFGPYIDFNRLALKLPGFTLNVLKYMNDKTHIFRYTCKNVKSGEVYFVVCVTLLHGEDIQRAVEEDERAAAGHENGDGEYVDEGVD